MLDPLGAYSWSVHRATIASRVTVDRVTLGFRVWNADDTLESGGADLARAPTDPVSEPMLARWISGPASLRRVLTRRSSCAVQGGCAVGPNGEGSRIDSVLILPTIALVRHCYSSDFAPAPTAAGTNSSQDRKQPVGVFDLMQQKSVLYVTE